MDDKRQKLKWATVWLIVLAAILVPFVLFGAQLERLAGDAVALAEGRPAMAALVLAGLLSGDILLPVPSSIVSTACGVLFGFLFGTLVSFAGMTVSCVLGYGLARWLGERFVRRFVGECEMQRMQSLNRRYGDWVIILARPVPVLAEASMVFAGFGRMPVVKCALLCSLSNLGVSAVYASVGASSSLSHTFLPALGASVLLPWLVMAVANAGWTSRARRGETIREGDPS